MNLKPKRRGPQACLRFITMRYGKRLKIIVTEQHHCRTQSSHNDLYFIIEFISERQLSVN